MEQVVCFLCDAMVKRRRTLEDHVKVRHFRYHPFACPKCEKTVTSLERYSDHAQDCGTDEKPLERNVHEIENLLGIVIEVCIRLSYSIPSFHTLSSEQVDKLVDYLDAKKKNLYRDIGVCGEKLRSFGHGSVVECVETFAMKLSRLDPEEYFDHLNASVMLDQQAIQQAIVSPGYRIHAITQPDVQPAASNVVTMQQQAVEVKNDPESLRSIVQPLSEQAVPASDVASISTGRSLDCNDVEVESTGDTWEPEKKLIARSSHSIDVFCESAEVTSRADELGPVIESSDHQEPEPIPAPAAVNLLSSDDMEVYRSIHDDEYMHDSIDDDQSGTSGTSHHGGPGTSGTSHHGGPGTSGTSHHGGPGTSGISCDQPGASGSGTGTGVQPSQFPTENLLSECRQTVVSVVIEEPITSTDDEFPSKFRTSIEEFQVEEYNFSESLSSDSVNEFTNFQSVETKPLSQEQAESIPEENDYDQILDNIRNRPSSPRTRYLPSLPARPVAPPAPHRKQRGTTSASGGRPRPVMTPQARINATRVQTVQAETAQSSTIEWSNTSSMTMRKCNICPAPQGSKKREIFPGNKDQPDFDRSLKHVFEHFIEKCKEDRAMHWCSKCGEMGQRVAMKRHAQQFHNSNCARFILRTDAAMTEIENAFYQGGACENLFSKHMTPL